MATTVKPRAYHSARTGADPEAAKLSLDKLRTLFVASYKQLRGLSYWAEAFGFYCVDSDEVSGAVGSDVENYVLLRTRKELWPVESLGPYYGEADLFDMIEFLFDHVSKPIDGWFHSHASCGMHWEKFDRPAGQAEFRDAMCVLLESYGPGYELNTRGEITELGPKGLKKLLKATPPTADGDVEARLDSAIDRFLRYGSTVTDRRHAVRDLADILEKLRPKMKDVLLSKDEADLFNLANNFGIRHANEAQKTNYDQAVWLSWMFYHYLATINACLHMLKRKAKRP